MGFDFTISLALNMCPKTGKPFFYEAAFGYCVKNYTLPDIQVPEDLREYLELRGHHLHAYVEHWDATNLYDVSAERMLDSFPSWEQYKKSSFAEFPEDSDDEDSWNEKDHNSLRTLLEWCCRQGVSFHVSWSY